MAYIDKEKITEILKAYTKKYNIAASSVILEEYAEELAKNDVIKVVRCKDCIYHIAEYCTRDIKGRTNMFYMTADDFCSYGVKKDCTDNKLVTQFDYFKASIAKMSIDEIAKVISGSDNCEKFCAYTKNGYCNKFADDDQGDCVDGVKQWLEQEVSE